MSIARAATGRPIAVAMLFAGVVLVGALSAVRLPIELLPDIAYPRLVVAVTYLGAAPADVERAVTEPVERAVAGVIGLEEVRSVARDGVSVTTLRFSWGTDMDFAALAVRERLDELRGALPRSASRPVVLRTDPASEPFMTVTVSSAGRGRGTVASGDLVAIGELAEQIVKRRLEQIDGVAQAAVTGAAVREVHVDVLPERLESLRLTIADVAAAVHRASASGGGGTVREGRYRYALRTLGQLTNVDELRDVMVTAGDAGGSSGGAGTEIPPVPPVHVRLGDVARVEDGVRERESLTRLDGREAVGLLLYAESNANVVQATRRVEAAVEELRAEYPTVAIDAAGSQASFVSAAIGNVVQEVVAGGALAFLVLFAFLRDGRAPLAIAAVIPIAVIATFALLDLADASLNIMSLGGLALGVGLLMDNSIVVVENVVRHRELGVAPADAAAVGTEEVQAPIVASTLTTIAVFGPIVYVRGVAGQLFGALSLAVACALAASVAVALTLVPALAARWRQVGLGVEGVAVPARLDALTAAYERVLLYALDHRRAVVLLALALSLLTAAVAASLDRSVLPDVDQRAFRVRLALPRGTPLGHTASVAGPVEAVLRADPAVDAVLLQVGLLPSAAGTLRGDAGPNVATFDVRVREGAHTSDAIARLRPRVAALSTAAVFDVGGASALGALAGIDADVAVHVVGDDLATAGPYARRLGAALARVPALTDVRVTGSERQPELHLQVARDRAAELGVEPSAVARAVESHARGEPAGELAVFDGGVPIIVRAPDSSRHSLASLHAVRVAGVPMREVARARESTGPAEVRRVGQRRVTLVSATVAHGTLAEALRATRGTLVALPPPAGLRVEVRGENEEVRRSFRALALAFGLAVLLVYMILAAEFESLLHPFTVLLSVPLALVGAVVALWVTGAGLNAVSFIGLVVLVGIVDNDAVVKVDFILQMRRRGAGVREAILAAGHARLRPILINTVTALLGLLPMALGIGPGAALQAPLAIAVFGGLLSATALTLVVIPVAYSLVEDVRGWLRRSAPRRGAKGR